MEKSFGSTHLIGSSLNGCVLSKITVKEVSRRALHESEKANLLLAPAVTNGRGDLVSQALANCH